MNVEIGTIITEPYHDPYHRSQCVATTVELTINPDTGYVTVGNAMDQGAIDADEWHNRVIVEALSSVEDGVISPDADTLKEYLCGDAAQELFSRIIDNYVIEWNGHNIVGHHTDTSFSALVALLTDIGELPHTTWQMWTVHEWLYEAKEYYIYDRIGRTVSDRVLAARTKALENVAHMENIILDGDILDALTEWRDEARS